MLQHIPDIVDTPSLIAGAHQLFAASIPLPGQITEKVVKGVFSFLFLRVLF
ncbi:Hypothetical protein c1566 [Escherichia coli CFT073]|uniref:Uncharacterized protein n=2 Tax=Escherichia coli TaxID=562 RepID=A0A0H2V8Y2_ECOL6|nr:Hypothetical protein c1566 [Escherichia coli CFT073]ABE06789.1 hypothetical protein UTI89_C1307 [Escherichia coli UTI89]EYE06575.1 hypothetical protein AC80_1419 [Escherichia coli 1-110-08_S4_C1]KEO41174.1 hypothetical protein AB34_1434 [Escherichia coli 2-460-02_S1_C2]KGM76272.1 hypothetical protein EL80_5106 [Escherichia coli]